MPSGMAAEMRAALQTWDRSGLVPERSNKSTTGFTNVIKVKGKFQARLSVPGNGRGGIRKRKQVHLPGLFDTAEDAAVYLASFKKGMCEAGFSAAEAADKIEPQDKEHKSRQPLAQQPAAPPTLPMFALEPPVTVVWVCQFRLPCIICRSWQPRRFRCSRFATHHRLANSHMYLLCNCICANRR